MRYLLQHPLMTQAEAQALAREAIAEDAVAETLDSPIYTMRRGIAWDDGDDYGMAGDGPRFHGLGATWEEALSRALDHVEDMERQPLAPLCRGCWTVHLTLACPAKQILDPRD